MSMTPRVAAPEHQHQRLLLLELLEILIFMNWQFDPRNLSTLEAVNRLGSFAAAAAELGYTQSAVSQQVAALERQVGVRVLSRRPVRLSDAGRILLGAESAITASMSSAATELAALAEGSTGVVRLGAFISAAATIAPPALAGLRATHPGVHLVLREIEQTEIHAALLRGDLDLAITFDYAHAPIPAPPGIRQRHLMDDPILVVLPQDHPLAGSTIADPVDVRPFEWINTNVDVDGLTSSETSDAHQALDFEGQDFRTALNLVAAGLGVALLPSLALHHATPGAVARPMAGHALVRRLYTARLDTTTAPAPVRRLETCLHDAALTLTATGAAPDTTGTPSTQSA
jgi:DNA-binding transcriptional LysR family regulator